MNEVFLIDSNIFITPYQNYYKFSIAPSYWEQLSEMSLNGKVLSLDSVRDELCVEKKEEKKDTLQKWVEGSFKGDFKQKNTEKVVKQYARIINYIRESDLYSDQALQTWSNIKVADPWIVAVAKVYDYTVVTFEKYNNSLSSKQPAKNPKIPNICEEFNVRYTGLFEMMEKLNIVL